MAGIYIHIPFCKQACHYCDFHFSTNLGKKEAMLQALEQELFLRKEELKKDKVETIYFGGGTPSVLEVGEIDSLLATVANNYNVIEKPEITLEANPDDLTTQKIRALAKSRVNRLSIGIQSFFEKDLKLMNRAHNADQAERCIAEASTYFNNISIDLIYGIPNMSNSRWKQNIAKALAFSVPHISSYALTVEPKTALANYVAKGLITPVKDKVAQEQFNILNETLSQQGYDAYEISNFGRPGYHSKNNTAYWQQKKYLGIGPSAHSYDGVRRGWNNKSNPKYIAALSQGKLPMEVEVLSKTDRYNEYVMTGLRTIWGISLSKIALNYGTQYKTYLLRQSKRHIEEHLLYLDGDTLLTTKKGKFLADGIASDLFMVNLER